MQASTPIASTLSVQVMQGNHSSNSLATQRTVKDQVNLVLAVTMMQEVCTVQAVKPPSTPQQLREYNTSQNQINLR